MKPIPFAEINRELVPKDPLEQAQFGAALFEKCRLAHNAEPKTSEGKRRQKTLWLPKIRAACKLIAEGRMLLPEPKGEFDIRFDKRAFLSSDIGAKRLGLIDIGKSFEKTPIHDTPDVDPLEDFTTYTEYDPNSKVTVAATTISADMDRNAKAYVYRDCGAGHFVSFTHLCRTKAISATAANAAGLAWGVSDLVGDARQWYNKQALGLFWYTISTTSFQLYLRDFYDNESDYCALTINTNYYLTVERAGSTALAHIYSDSDRQTLVDTMSVSPSSTATYRYVYPVASFYTGGTGIVSYVFADLDLGEVSFQPAWAEGINTHHF